MAANKPTVGRTVHLTLRTAFGRTLLYPANGEARMLCSLTGGTTLTAEHLTTIKRLGYTITIISEHAQTIAKLTE